MKLSKAERIFEKIMIGEEISILVQKEKYIYRAYRIVGKKYKLSEDSARECYNYFLAYDFGRKKK